MINHFKSLKQAYSGFIMLAVFAFMNIAVTAEQNPTPTNDYQVIQKIKVPAGFTKVNSIILSPDGNKVYSVFSNTKKIDVPGGKALSYMVITHPDLSVEVPNQAVLLMDNKLISPSAMTIFPPMLSKDLKNISYTYQYPKEKPLAPNKCGLMLNEKEVLTTIKDTALPYEVAFSPDNTKFAIVVDSGNFINPPKNGAYLMVNDKKISPDFQMIHSPVFSPDGSQIAYFAGNKYSLFGGCKECCIMLGEQNVSSTLPWVDSPVFSINNKLAYLAGNGKKKWLIYDGKKISPELNDIRGDNGTLDKIEESFMKSSPSDFTINADGSRIAYRGKLDRKWSIWINDQKISTDELAEVGTPIFSPDGSKIAYKAKTKDNKWLIMLNNEPFSPEFDAIKGGPVFSSDGTKIAYVAGLNKKWFIMVNSEKISADYDYSTEIKKGEYSYLNPGVMKESAINLIGFTPEGNKIAYLVKYLVKFFTDDSSKMTIHSFIMINEHQVTPDSNSFVIRDCTMNKTGVYFVGYNSSFDFSIKNKPGLQNQTEEIYTEKINGDIVHGLAVF